MDHQSSSIDAPTFTSPFATSSRSSSQSQQSYRPQNATYEPTKPSHVRRGSVVDAAAEMMGPNGFVMLGKARSFTSKMEDKIDSWSRPLRPWLPALGRFLIVVTFLEDAIRIMTQSRDQNYYLQKHRGFPWGISHAFLFLNVFVMITGSSMIIAKKFTEYATAGLFAVVVAQGFGYGLIFDMNFFLRNLSVLGGLLMVLSDSLSVRKNLFAGLPTLEINEVDRKKYFQLAGRVLLIFLFLGFAFNGKFTIARAVVSVVGLAACVMVAVGFKTKWSALFLVSTLSIFNIFINNWWSVHSGHPQRDFLKYDFFQTLSIVGGLLLLTSMGGGDISLDSKKSR